MKRHIRLRRLSGLVALSRGKASGYPRLTVSGVRRALIYKPLAILMSILLLPSIPRVQHIVGVPAEIEAQSGPPVPIGGCAAADVSKFIIREYCSGDGKTNYFSDLTQLESDAVKAFLASHNLPETDASVIYDYGRADLRTKIRALISSTLLGIVNKDPSKRTLHEQQLYSWLQSWVNPEEVALYTTAVAHYQSFVNDPCHFTLDAELAKTYGLTYDGTPFCGNSLATFFGLPVPVVPSVSYFKAYGLKHSYLKQAATDPKYANLLADLNVGLAVVAGTVALGAIAVGTGLGLAGSYAAALAAWTTGTATGSGLAGSSSAFILSGGAVEATGVAGLVAGPVVIILIAIAIGVAAGVQVFNYQDSLNQLNILKTTLTRVTNEATDLKGLVADTTGIVQASKHRPGANAPRRPQHNSPAGSSGWNRSALFRRGVPPASLQLSRLG